MSILTTFHKYNVRIEMNGIHALVLCLLMFVGCNNPSRDRHQLARAEEILEYAPDSALLILDDMRSRNGLSEDVKAKSTLLTAKARLSKGESFLTVDSFDEALDYFEEKKDSAALLDMYQLAAIKMHWLNRQDSAAYYLSKAIKLASKTSKPSKSELLIELSNLYAIPALKKNYPLALSYACESMKVARTNEEKARALHDVGLFYSYIGQNDSASFYMEKALSETDVDDPQFATYALNYASLPSANIRVSVENLHRISTQSLGKLITLGYIYLNHAQIDSARYYLKESKRMYDENPARYSINTYNNLRLLEESIRLIEKGKIDSSEATVTNDSISEIADIQSKISEERRDYNNQLKIQLLQEKSRRQFHISLGLGIILCLTIGFGIYIWNSKRKYLKLKRQLDNVKVEQIVVEAKDDENEAPHDLIRRRLNICIEQFRESKLQANFDRMTVEFRNAGKYPSLKKRESIQKMLISCFADFIVDMKMTGTKLNMEDIVTCIMSCLRESNVTIAACLGTTDTAIRTRKSRLRAKLPPEIRDMLEL